VPAPKGPGELGVGAVENAFRGLLAAGLLRRPGGRSDCSVYCVWSSIFSVRKRQANVAGDAPC
jgi:hypothetical protein